MPTVCFAAVEIALRALASKSAESALPRCSKSALVLGIALFEVLGCFRKQFFRHWDALGRTFHAIPPRGGGQAVDVGGTIAITFTLAPRGHREVQHASVSASSSSHVGRTERQPDGSSGCNKSVSRRGAPCPRRTAGSLFVEHRMPRTPEASGMHCNSFMLACFDPVTAATYGLPRSGRLGGEEFLEGTQDVPDLGEATRRAIPGIPWVSSTSHIKLATVGRGETEQASNFRVLRLLGLRTSGSRGWSTDAATFERFELLGDHIRQRPHVAPDRPDTTSAGRSRTSVRYRIQQPRDTTTFTSPVSSSRLRNVVPPAVIGRWRCVTNPATRTLPAPGT